MLILLSVTFRFVSYIQLFIIHTRNMTILSKDLSTYLDGEKCIKKLFAFFFFFYMLPYSR